MIFPDYQEEHDNALLEQKKRAEEGFDETVKRIEEKYKHNKKFECGSSSSLQILCKMGDLISVFSSSLAEVGGFESSIQESEKKAYNGLRIQLKKVILILDRISEFVNVQLSKLKEQLKKVNPREKSQLLSVLKTTLLNINDGMKDVLNNSLSSSSSSTEAAPVWTKKEFDSVYGPPGQEREEGSILSQDKYRNATSPLPSDPSLLYPFELKKVFDEISEISFINAEFNRIMIDMNDVLTKVLILIATDVKTLQKMLEDCLKIQEEDASAGTKMMQVLEGLLGDKDADEYLNVQPSNDGVDCKKTSPSSQDSYPFSEREEDPLLPSFRGTVDDTKEQLLKWRDFDFTKDTFPANRFNLNETDLVMEEEKVIFRAINGVGQSLLDKQVSTFMEMYNSSLFNKNVNDVRAILDTLDDIHNNNVSLENTLLALFFQTHFLKRNTLLDERMKDKFSSMAAYRNLTFSRFNKRITPLPYDFQMIAGLPSRYVDKLLVVSPTGSGKSLIWTNCAKLMLRKGVSPIYFLGSKNWKEQIHELFSSRFWADEDTKSLEAKIGVQQSNGNDLVKYQSGNNSKIDTSDSYQIFLDDLSGTSIIFVNAEVDEADRHGLYNVVLNKVLTTPGNPGLIIDEYHKLHDSGNEIVTKLKQVNNLVALTATPFKDTRSIPFLNVFQVNSIPVCRIDENNVPSINAPGVCDLGLTSILEKAHSVQEVNDDNTNIIYELSCSVISSGQLMFGSYPREKTSLYKHNPILPWQDKLVDNDLNIFTTGLDPDVQPTNVIGHADTINSVSDFISRIAVSDFAHRRIVIILKSAWMEEVKKSMSSKVNGREVQVLSNDKDTFSKELSELNKDFSTLPTGDSNFDKMHNKIILYPSERMEGYNVKGINAEFIVGFMSAADVVQARGRIQRMNSHVRFNNESDRFVQYFLVLPSPVSKKKCVSEAYSYLEKEVYFLSHLSDYLSSSSPVSLTMRNNDWDRQSQVNQEGEDIFRSYFFDPGTDHVRGLYGFPEAKISFFFGNAEISEASLEDTAKAREDEFINCLHRFKEKYGYLTINRPTKFTPQKYITDDLVTNVCNMNESAVVQIADSFFGKIKSTLSKKSTALTVPVDKISEFSYVFTYKFLEKEKEKYNQNKKIGGNAFSDLLRSEFEKRNKNIDAEKMIQFFGENNIKINSPDWNGLTPNLAFLAVFLLSTFRNDVVPNAVRNYIYKNLFDRISTNNSNARATLLYIFKDQLPSDVFLAHVLGDNLSSDPGQTSYPIQSDDLPVNFEEFKSFSNIDITRGEDKVSGGSRKISDIIVSLS